MTNQKSNHIYGDFCKTITENLFSIIEEHGSLGSWRKEWASKGCGLLPVGGKGLYKGCNMSLLWFDQYKHGYESNRWYTFKQLKAMGESVKKGAKSKKVIFWQILDKTSEKESEKFAFARAYSVFNADQTTIEEKEASEANEFDTASLLDALDIKLEHFGNQPRYQPADDVIVMPKPDSFSEIAAYNATFLHELVHSTGHKDRLDRAGVQKGRSKKEIAKEELIAEIGSTLLAAHFSIASDIENHASYIEHWQRDLNEKEVMQAANQAAKAFHYIVEKAS